MAAIDERVFVFARVRAATGGWQALHDRLMPGLRAWPQARVLGCFMGLFGISNQELFLMISLPCELEATATIAAHLPPDVELTDVLPLKATARPADHSPIARGGIYVFRFFEVPSSNVQQVVDLSVTAWQTFEKDDAYASEPYGLFRFADEGATQGRMLLLTWYDSFASWERSRSPHPEASANFRQRAALVRSALPYATRLVVSE